MKKVYFIFGILTTLSLNAKDFSDTYLDSMEENQIKNIEVQKQTNFLAKKVKGQPVVYVSTCGISVTTSATDNWGWAELMEWAERIEANYCAPNAPFSNESGVI